MTLALSTVFPSDLISEIAGLVADLAGKKDIGMTLEITENLPSIEADELRVREVVYNLLSNAVKFTPAGGTIGIRTRTAPSEIEVVVWDSGVGIARENMERIFEGFFRVDTPYSRLTEGTGLGLPLARKMVELHGGRLVIESPGLNQGTVATFTLPIASSRGL